MSHLADDAAPAGSATVAANGGAAFAYEPVIGLEIHAQLRTATKIFCGCATAYGAAPNSQVCPVCLGLPGALPVLNAAAVDAALMAALALGCDVQPRSLFARKNYFYPDLPKGYQISQYELPLALGGQLTINADGRQTRVHLHRIHIEEDAGKSLHEGFADSAERAYLDFNRAGVPLIEIVTEPDIRSAAAAAGFFEQLRQLLVWLGVNDGNMEEGSLRCDANVSVRRRGDLALGTKAEIKNVNSFRYLQKAIEYEVARQIDVLEDGQRVVAETRLFDAAQGRTYSMRSKEDAHDYRYFPEPDLPPLVVSRERVAAVAARLPELPEARHARFLAEYALPAYDAGVLTQTRELADYFEELARAAGNPKAASNWVMGELLRTLKERGGSIDDLPVRPAALAALVRLVDAGAVSSTVAKEVFATMLASGRGAEDIVQGDGLAQTSDTEALRALVRAALSAHPDAVAQIRQGRTNATGFLVGQVMKASRGKANPVLVNALLTEALAAHGES